MPLAPGTGNAGLSRWYYNADDRECVSFQYNGKRGNQNNFLTQLECKRICPGKKLSNKLPVQVCKNKKS